MNNAFLFFNDIGKYTGQFALSMRNFYEKLEEVPSISLDFHLSRGDFENWVRDILGDIDLASKIGRVNRSLCGEDLRERMNTLVETRLDELEDVTLKRVSGIGPNWSRKLKEAGISSVEILVKHSAENLSDKVGVPQKIAEKWIKNAKVLLVRE
jgi:hypothetical protein